VPAPAAHVVRDRGALPRVSSVVFEHANLYSRFSGRDNLRFFAALYRVEPERVDAVLATVGLDALVAARPVRTYSTGMIQRLVLARALLPRPRVLLLSMAALGVWAVAPYLALLALLDRRQ
jgi:ABC-type multidrug transport system ATPase subunit